MTQKNHQLAAELKLWTSRWTRRQLNIAGEVAQYLREMREDYSMMICGHLALQCHGFPFKTYPKMKMTTTGITAIVLCNTLPNPAEFPRELSLKAPGVIQAQVSMTLTEPRRCTFTFQSQKYERFTEIHLEFHENSGLYGSFAPHPLKNYRVLVAPLPSLLALMLFDWKWTSMQKAEHSSNIGFLVEHLAARGGEDCLASFRCLWNHRSVLDLARMHAKATSYCKGAWAKIGLFKTKCKQTVSTKTSLELRDVVDSPDSTDIDFALKAAKAAVDVLHEFGYRCAIFGSLGCYLYSKSPIHTPNDVDIMIFPGDTNSKLPLDVDEIRLKMVAKYPHRFELLDSTKKEWKILHHRCYTGPTVGYARLHKIDLLAAGQKNLPSHSYLSGPKGIELKDKIPVFPFPVLLLHKLQGWALNRGQNDRRDDRRQLARTQAINDLLQNRLCIDLKCFPPWSDQRLFSTQYILDAKQWAVDFDAAASEKLWQKIGFVNPPVPIPQFAPQPRPIFLTARRDNQANMGVPHACRPRPTYSMTQPYPPQFYARGGPLTQM
ncbi:hypothetical protein BDN72DRAFT_846310 [Pluteus cervinus]|uniref:Uncharacterized protein n=1 Tax=Pluteus cervinus TaxID=181527 RepID=A0ACD3AG69_9AGAR|nr:hypothetical protein BDN72DRAFT_846310 [Pluteus cervinus]